jgi:hypothetical protein
LGSASDSSVTALMPVLEAGLAAFPARARANALTSPDRDLTMELNAN